MTALVQLMAELAAGNVEDHLRRLRRRTVFHLLAALFALTGYVAGLIALALVFVPAFGALGASVLVAGLALAAALGLYLTIAVSDRLRSASKRTLVAHTALTLAPSLVRSGSPLSLLAVGGLGYAAAEMMRGRSHRN